MKIVRVFQLAIILLGIWASCPHFARKAIANAERRNDDHRAFEWVLTYAHPPDKIISGQKPFLLLLWLSKGNPRHGYCYCLAENGVDDGRRLIYNYAVQGGNELGQSAAVCRELRALPSLPVGISDPHSVPYGSLLIVSMRKGQT